VRSLTTSDLDWNFNYGESADLAPHPTRQLQKTDVGNNDVCPLQTMEAEEMSNEGTKSWLTHLIRSQLGLGDDTLAKQIVLMAIWDCKSHPFNKITDDRRAA
jgi:hypothetical protein